MMFAKDEAFRQHLLLDAELRKLAREQILEEELLAQPERDRHAEALEPARRESEIALEQALELQKRLVVEGDEVDLRETHARLAQAVGKCLRGKMRVVLLAGEALLL